MVSERYCEKVSNRLNKFCGLERFAGSRVQPRDEAMTRKLTSKDLFPSLGLKLAGGELISLPAGLNSPMTVVLIFRGHW